jgi:hypothetical protein
MSGPLPFKYPTFLQQYPLQKGILISQHEALIRRTPMGRLEIMKVGLMNSNGLLQLLDVFRPALSKGCLGLTVSLLPLLGGSIYLGAGQ